MSTNHPSTETRVSGEVVYLYAFDVANEIKTSKVQEILSEKPEAFHIRMDRAVPKDMPLYKPLFIEPPAPRVAVNGMPIRVQVRVYEVGVVSIAVRVDFRGRTLRELVGFHEPSVSSGEPLDRFARQICQDVTRSIADLMVKGHDPAQPEAYTAFCVTGIEGWDDVDDWLSDNASSVAALLNETEEASRLSPTQVSEVLRLRVSYENTDLVVIDWDAAIVCDLNGYVDDVLYVLELANLQIEEFRTLDQQLDSHLNRTYELFEERRVNKMRRSTPILMTLRNLRIDFAKLTDEVDHIGKFFGDWYLARVYLGARERFHLEAWRRSVNNRLEQLDKLYSVVHSEAYERRMLYLEATIVVLFVVDLVALFWKS